MDRRTGHYRIRWMRREGRRSGEEDRILQCQVDDERRQNEWTGQQEGRGQEDGILKCQEDDKRRQKELTRGQDTTASGG